MSKCSDNAQKLANDLFGEKRISKKRLEEITNQLAQRARNLARSEGKTLEESMSIVSSEFKENLRFQALKDKQRVYLNTLRMNANKDIIEGFKDKAKGLRSIIDGTTKFRQSISNLIPSTFNRLMGGADGVWTKLRQEGLEVKLKDNSIQLDLARALGNELVEDIEVKRIAEIIKEGYKTAREIQNSEGASIGELDDFIASQSHDPLKMLALDSNPFVSINKRVNSKLKGEDTRTIAKQRWIDFIWDKLDHDKTFRDIPNTSKEKFDFLSSTFEAVVSGIRKDVDVSLEVDTGFKRGKSFASRLSGERVLKFKNADSWFEYNKIYGTGSVQNSILHVFDRASRNIAILKKLGPNAMENYERLKKSVRELQRDDPSINSKLEKIDHIIKDITGVTNSPIHLRFARISTNLRIAQNLSKLGLVTVRSVPDLAAGAANMRFNGVGLTDRWTAQLDILKSLFGEDKDLKEVHDLLGTSAHAMKGATIRFGIEDGVSGLMTQAEQFFFKWNLLKNWDHVNREGMVTTLARNLALNKHLKFEELNHSIQNALSIYDINPNEWEALRKYTYKTEKGKEFITADSVNHFNTEDIANILDKPLSEVSSADIKKVKDNLIDKVMVYFNDNANHAILEPTAGDRALIIRGQQRGTPLGEALRFIAQFKMYSVAFARRVLPRVASGRDSISALAELTVSMALLEYVQMSATSIIKGQTPVNPSKIEKTSDKVSFYLKLFTPGMGIWGDFIGGEYNRYGGGVFDSLAGPVLSSTADLAKMFATLKEGNNPSKAMFHFLKGNTPFINMIWTFPAMKFLILNSIEERINPGALRRARERLLENGQDFYINP